MRLQLAATGLIVAVTVGCSGDSGGASGDNVAEHGLTVNSSHAQAGGSGDEATADAHHRGWPMWRGPFADGISRETGWQAQWPDDGPETLWKKSIGIGFSSMSVVDGRLYAMGHRGGEESVYCLNAETGEEIWTHSYKGKLVNNLHEGGPCATPTVDGDVVYTLGREGQLHCLNAKTGEPVWSKELQTELGVKLPDWGFSCSPLVLGDTLLIEAGRIASFNKRTGGRIWQTAGHSAGYGAPCAFRSGQDLLIAVLNNDHLLVVRAEDGKEIAKEKWVTSYKTNSTTPIVADGHIFISTGYNKGCAMFRFDGGKLEFVYANKRIRNHFNNCVLFEGNLYGVDGNSNSSRNCKVVCMDWKTGDLKWEQRGLGCGSLLVADGRLIILSDKGKLVVAEATPEKFNQISSAQVLRGKCWTVPVLAAGRIYCRNAAGVLVCLDVRK